MDSQLTIYLTMKLSVRLINWPRNQEKKVNRETKLNVLHLKRLRRINILNSSRMISRGSVELKTNVS
jgi:hypothetical protein